MLYDYQYALTAVFLTLVMIVLAYQRKGYASVSRKIFTQLMFCNLLTAAADIGTFFTISYPYRFPRFILYASNIVYLLLFCVQALTFVRYATSLLGRPEILKTGRRLLFWLTAILAAVLVTTPLTHAVIYFDANRVYHHGPLMVLAYLCPCIAALWMIVTLLKYRGKFNRFQVTTVITAFLMALVFCLLQRLIPRLEIGITAFTILLYIIYIVFENPAYATFGRTRCLNWHSLQHELEAYAARNEDCSVILIGIANHPENRSLDQINRFDAINERMAERLATHYGRKTFCVDSGKFVLVLPQTVSAAEAHREIAGLFSAPLELEDETCSVQALDRRLAFLSLRISDDFVTHFIESVKHFSIEVLFETANFRDLLLEQHETELAEDAAARAIENNLFEVWYQPIYENETGKFHSAEALLRVKDIYAGNIEKLISAAEQNRSIIRIEETIFEQICSFLASGVLRGTSLRFIEVNMSVVHFMQEGVAGAYIRKMREYGIRPDQINLEITESSVLAENAAVQENFRILSEYGVTFSVDDYGSGFASADYLYRLPISIVKVDKSLLWQAAKDSNARLVFESTMRLIKRLGKKIVVEGAEDEDMLRLIRMNGGDYVQGYYYSKPLPREAFVDFLKTAGRSDNPDK